MRILAILIGFMVLALDLLTKSWVKTSLWGMQSHPVLDRFLTLHYAENTGIAFGLLDDVQSAWKGPLLGTLAVVALAMVVYYICTTPERERLTLVAFGLVMGGILGNFIDRLRHGYVVDFIKVHWHDMLAWPSFNLADSAITTGVVLILGLGLFESFQRSARSTVEE